jgi:hypothetical protein
MKVMWNRFLSSLLSSLLSIPFSVLFHKIYPSGHLSLANCVDCLLLSVDLASLSLEHPFYHPFYYKDLLDLLNSRPFAYPPSLYTLGYSKLQSVRTNTRSFYFDQVSE